MTYLPGKGLGARARPLPGYLVNCEIVVLRGACVAKNGCIPWCHYFVNCCISQHIYLWRFVKP